MINFYKKCFCETHGTPFFGFKTPTDEIAKVLVLIPKLGSIRAVARETNHKPDTIISWIELLNDSIMEINNYLYNNLHYSEAQIDEIWSCISKRKRKFNNERMK